MSSETQPIDPARFAEALKELSAESLALKVLELRNAIAHLDYSNAELKPYAEGRAPAGEPDPDCAEAIAENVAVIARMQDRIERVRAEVESRGLSWREFQGKPDDEEQREGGEEGGGEGAAAGSSANLTNGVNGHGTGSGEAEHPAWRDGTFQTGTISQLSDEERELLRQLESRIPLDDDEEEDDPEGGMHL
ncbi:uncharacterized protein F4807DRAFT_426645 [Annulohypoxylon truncatum]|uniref:uncharacterized protein n=1 Tax=Annulohypoxylon truncatum TaxID=327061 RepID=UPI002008B778|nr:uncharacterized protein F4807DRAFT_426645 [Annulohypoxylon truncatum]KAI1209414.1 hypothetical protein F4807DRAFT_426645 [Annulohypoxylon truncatum]